MSKSDEQRSRFLLLYSGEDTGYIFSMSLNGTIAPAITMQGVGQITVIWGDGNTDSYTLTGVNQNITHTYGAGGTYNVKIKHAEQITKFDTSTNNNYSFDLSELEKFNENFYYFLVYGSNTITGDLSSLNGLSALYYFQVYGSNTISDYTTSTWTQTSFNHYEVTPAAGSGLSSSEVDQLLIDMDTGITWSGSGKMLWLAGNNAARTSASDAAVTSLQGKGVTVTTN